MANTDDLELNCNTRDVPVARADIASVIAQEYAPYPLTDIQQAYWIGEQPAYRLHTPAFLYRAFHAPDLDVARLTAAIETLTCAHPALRTSIGPDGTQTVHERGAPVVIDVNDLRTMPTAQRSRFVAERKQDLNAKLAPLGAAGAVRCFVDRVEDGYHIHFLFRLIALDGQSIVQFLNELARIYLGRAGDALPGLSHHLFVCQQAEAREGPSWQASLAYWEQRLEALPNAPELPLVDHDAIPQRLRFTRRQFRLDAQQFAQLQAQARRLGVTVNALLCTLYADVLRMWSRNRSFTLNMLVSQRPAAAPELRAELGNFSSTLLLELADAEGGLPARALALQCQLYRDLEHAQVSGVELVRRMKRGGDGLPAMPVVFASTLATEPAAPSVTHRDLGWSVHDGALHTPQVWLDHQVYLDEDQLVLNWDSALGVFLPGVIEQMFTVYQAHVHALLKSGDGRVPLPGLPQRMLAARQAANETAAPLPRGTLHGFFEAARRAAQGETAILSASRTLTYDELWALTTRLASQLRGHGVGRNDLVAVLARRGWRQVAAAVGVTQAGGAYLPVAADLPAARQLYLVGQPRVKVLLAERDLLADLALPAGVVAIALEDALPDGPVGAPADLAPLATEDDLAYVIFTSGSTGTPKGVAITHRAAVNTVQDVMQRFGMRRDDRVIGISAFNFDLSVYDIFGTLAGGATLVLPRHSATPDPEHWAALVQEHGVTVWNTVPALLEMQLEYCGASAARQLASLRLAMLSGDWIPVSLPARLAAQVPQAMLVSLGGATEAAIWSNYFVVHDVDPAWKSIPYGWPLSNQEFHVLDAHFQPAPTWCAGELYIGGTGLAQGYYADPVRTAASFVFHPRTGERLYRTGDMGRYHPSGHIEFLGRSDTQVKIRGYRIELGEVEAALERCPGVRGGAVVVRTLAADRQLAAFFTAHGAGCDAQAVHDHLQSVLPPYMVPATIVPVEQIPVTPNGKIDRKTLQAMAAALGQADVRRTAPRTKVERQLAAIWEDLLQTTGVGVDDEFFQLGGTSLLAVRLLNAIACTFGKQLQLASLLRNGTVAGQARLLDHDDGAARAPLVPIRAGREAVLALVHPVGGNVLCYRELAALVPEGVEVVGLQSQGDGAARSVPSMAAAYVAALASHVRATGGRPLHLMGWSMGGVLAHEMARQLEAGGTPVASLTMIDSWCGKADAQDRLEGFALLKRFIRDFLNGGELPVELDALASCPEPERTIAALDMLRVAGSVAGHFSPEIFAALRDEYAANFNALIRHRPGAARVPVHLYRATRSEAFPFLAPFDLAGYGAGRAPVLLDEDHFSVLREAVLRGILHERFSADCAVETPC